MPKDSTIKKSASIPTILVSNGGSYLGVRLCAALLEKGARVVALDTVTDSVKDRTSSLLNNPKFALFNADPDKGVPEKIQSVDYVYQLLYPDDLMLSDSGDLVSQAFGTKSLLDLAVASNAKFALVEPLFSVRKGEGADVGYLSYDKNSEFLRSLVWDYVKNKKLNGRVVRLGPVYGPGMSLDSPEGLSGLVDSVLQEKPLRIYGEGIDKIPYLYVDDAVDGLIKALFYKRTSGRVFKLLEEESHADLELAFILRSMAGVDLKIAYVDEPKEYIVSVDTLHGEQVPRWAPEVSLKAGLKATLEGFEYDTNLHAFKPAKLIESKLSEKEVVAASRNAGAGTDATRVRSNESLKSITPRPSIFSKIKLPVLTNSLVPVRKFFEDVKSLLPGSRGNAVTPLAKKSVVPQKSLSSGVNWRYILSGVLIAGFFSLITPLALTLFFSRRAMASLEEVSLNLSQLQTIESQEASRQAFQDFVRAKNSFKQSRWLFGLLGQEDSYVSFDSTLESSVHFSGALYRTSKALDPFSSVWEVLKPTSSAVFSQEDFDSSLRELKNARRSLDMALANFDRVTVPDSPGFLAEKLLSYQGALIRADSLLKDALLVADSLPVILGVHRDQKYLLLFQNSNEIRPTGGFIGSYALLTLDKGKIKNLIIDDIYNPDGQIDSRGIVSDVPVPIQDFLGEEVLHIRNANWSPDFPTSVATIEDLFFKLENRTFDGVIALDLNMVRAILEVTGPVYLAAYNEEVNADNLYERTQFHAEFDYQEGISEKRNFLTVLGSKLLESLFGLSADRLPELLASTGASLEGRSLQVVLKDPVMASYLRERAWDGALASVEDSSDYLFVVNANLGGTKANYFVENSYEYSVTSDTRDGLLRSNLNLDYRHSGEDSAWPGGPYTNYMRVYVPLGSKLTGAKLVRNGAESEDILADVASSVDLGKAVFSTSFVLQPRESLRVEVTYDLPESLSLNKEAKDYSLYWQKQAGALNDLMRFNFRGPFGTEIVSYAPPEVGKEQNIAVLEGFLNSDVVIDLSLK